jgi:hypothetical protein
MWDTDVRGMRVSGSARRSRAPGVTVGSTFHVIPEDRNVLQRGMLNEKAKAVVLDPAEMSIFPERQGWHVEGSVAYFMR